MANQRIQNERKMDQRILSLQIGGRKIGLLRMAEFSVGCLKISELTTRFFVQQNSCDMGMM
jgi:hypothetical protein